MFRNFIPSFLIQWEKGVVEVKKYIAISAVCGAALLLYLMFFSASGVQSGKQQAKPQLQPGLYKVEYDKPDFRGWRAFFSMEVDSTGEIRGSSFDYVGPAGRLKTHDAEYNKRMKSKSGLGPSEYCPRFAKNLQVYQDPGQIDSITGATMSSRDFKAFARAAFNAAKTGNQATIYLRQPDASAPNK